MRLKDISGQRFGKLTAIRWIYTKQKRSFWECICDCGNVTEVCLTNLGRITNSCGCLKKEVAVERGVRTRKPLKETVANQVWSYYKRNAKNRNIPWEITKEQFSILIFSPCYYCGCIACNITKVTRNKYSKEREPRRTMKNNGVDRLNNSIGYTVDNSVSCCKHCNFAKNTRTVKEFEEWIEKIYSFLKEKGGYGCHE